MSIRAVNWAREVCERINAPSKHRLALVMIAIHHHDKTGECFPSYDTIATACGFSRRKVIDIIAEIEANGLIVRQKRRSGGHQGSNHYVLFGRPVGSKWTAPRVHSSTPCEGANGGTLPRVQTGAPDRDWSTKGKTQARDLRVVSGGRRHA